MAVTGLMANFQDGAFTESASSTSLRNAQETKGGGQIDSESFLTLLVAEMQNQDPLQPTSNTEWVSQYAQFTQTSAVQEIADSMGGVQANSLVGKSVIMKVTDSVGNTNYVDGMVERVGYEGNKAYLYIDGNPYSIDDLDTIISEEYMAADKKMSELHDLMNKLPPVNQITEDDQDAIFTISEILSTLTDYEKNFLNGDEMETMAEYLRKLSELIDERKAREEEEAKTEEPKTEEPKEDDGVEVVTEG
ncbi:MAG: hypothetical protein K6B44_00340 [Lachnospiraceae bacterium]|nr:hypothetical protein [Lachnospiraceae bacterium]